MRLKFYQFDLTWPKEISLEQLRPWILNQISEMGEPLRWAITSVQASASNSSARKLIVEAVLITA